MHPCIWHQDGMWWTVFPTLVWKTLWNHFILSSMKPSWTWNSVILIFGPCRMAGILFVCFCLLREREHVNGQGQSEREREDLKRSTLSECLMQGSISQLRDHDLSWNQESDTQPTEPPRCPEWLVLFRGQRQNVSGYDSRLLIRQDLFLFYLWRQMRLFSYPPPPPINLDRRCNCITCSCRW